MAILPDKFADLVKELGQKYDRIVFDAADYGAESVHAILLRGEHQEWDARGAITRTGREAPDHADPLGDP